MKNKILFLLLAVCMIVPCCFMFSACGKKQPKEAIQSIYFKIGEDIFYTDSSSNTIERTYGDKTEDIANLEVVGENTKRKITPMNKKDVNIKITRTFLALNQEQDNFDYFEEEYSLENFLILSSTNRLEGGLWSIVAAHFTSDHRTLYATIILKINPKNLDNCSQNTVIVEAASKFNLEKNTVYCGTYKSGIDLAVYDSDVKLNYIDTYFYILGERTSNGTVVPVRFDTVPTDILQPFKYAEENNTTGAYQLIDITPSLSFHTLEAGKYLVCASTPGAPNYTNIFTRFTVVDFVKTAPTVSGNLTINWTYQDVAENVTLDDILKTATFEGNLKVLAFSDFDDSNNDYGAQKDTIEKQFSDLSYLWDYFKIVNTNPSATYNFTGSEQTISIKLVPIEGIDTHDGNTSMLTETKAFDVTLNISQGTIGVFGSYNGNSTFKMDENTFAPITQTVTIYEDYANGSRIDGNLFDISSNATRTYNNGVSTYSFQAGGNYQVVYTLKNTNNYRIIANTNTNNQITVEFVNVGGTIVGVKYSWTVAKMSLEGLGLTIVDNNDSNDYMTFDQNGTIKLKLGTTGDTTTSAKITALAQYLGITFEINTSTEGMEANRTYGLGTLSADPDFAGSSAHKILTLTQNDTLSTMNLYIRTKISFAGNDSFEALNKDCTLVIDLCENDLPDLKTAITDVVNHYNNGEETIYYFIINEECESLNDYIVGLDGIGNGSFTFADDYLNKITTAKLSNGSVLRLVYKPTTIWQKCSVINIYFYFNDPA